MMKWDTKEVPNCCNLPKELLSFELGRQVLFMWILFVSVISK